MLENSDLEQKLRDAIEKQEQNIEDAETSNEISYAVNMLKGLIKTYKDEFGGDQESGGDSNKNPNMSKVKNF